MLKIEENWDFTIPNKAVNFLNNKQIINEYNNK